MEKKLFDLKDEHTELISSERLHSLLAQLDQGEELQLTQEEENSFKHYLNQVREKGDENLQQWLPWWEGFKAFNFKIEEGGKASSDNLNSFQAFGAKEEEATNDQDSEDFEDLEEEELAEKPSREPILWQRFRLIPPFE